MFWIYAVSALCLSAGFAYGWWIIRRQRRASQVEDALLSWVEPPVPAWRQDRNAAWLILLHATSVAVLAILFLLNPSWSLRNHNLFLLDPTPYLSTADVNDFHQTLFGLGVWGLGIAWVICGSVLSFPLASLLIGPIAFHITPQGIVRGPYLYPWETLSHFRTFSGRRDLWIYLRRNPETVGIPSRPPSPAIYQQAAALLAARLPHNPILADLPWYQRRTTQLALLLFLTTLPLVGFGLILHLLALPWAWIYFSFAIPLVMWAGVWIFRHY